MTALRSLDDIERDATLGYTTMAISARLADDIPALVARVRDLEAKVSDMRSEASRAENRLEAQLATVRRETAERAAVICERYGQSVPDVADTVEEIHVEKLIAATCITCADYIRREFGGLP